MNVRLQYNLEFPGAIYHDDRLQLNLYSVAISMMTATKDSASINTAMNRLKWFVYSELENTVFVHQNQKEKSELMHLMGINVTTLPEEPVDQIVGMMLYYKLNAIMEDRMEIVQLDISSTLGDSVIYMHDNEDPPGPFAQNGWWNDSNCRHNDIEDTPSDDNVVKVTYDGWGGTGLEWPGEQNTVANTVVYANFPRDEH